MAQGIVDQIALANGTLTSAGFGALPDADRTRTHDGLLNGIQLRCRARPPPRLGLPVAPPRRKQRFPGFGRAPEAITARKTRSEFVS